MDPNKRKKDLERFYELLADLEKIHDGKIKLSRELSRNLPEKLGIEFFFEEGECRSGKSGLRVVRVGRTSNLHKRMLQHTCNCHLKKAKTGSFRQYMSQHKCNHRASSFRKLVGAALIGREGLHYQFPDWGQGRSAPREVRETERHLEKRVSAILMGKMSVLWLEVSSESEREEIQRNATALLSNFEEEPIDPPSDGWLGNYCTKKYQTSVVDNEEVKNSGLWFEHYVKTSKNSYDPEFINKLADLITQMKETT